MPESKMYTEWASLSPVIASNSCSAQNCVLNKFQGSAGKEVAVAIVKQLASNLGISQPAEPSNLITDQEVLWCMDVLCYGLSLPLTEHETIKDCVNVYCEWMTALSPVPRISVPKPIVDDPNTYARKIINHFHNLFVPRPGEGADTINRQAVLCHRVLRTLQNAAVSQILTRETWESLLLFLLAINEVLLAPPTVKDDVGDQLCERVLSVLFEVWLLACVRCYPSPSLWKTLQESCQMWRHRIALVEQWNRVNLALTARLIDFTYGSAFPEFKILDEDAQLIPAGMSNDCIAQTWYRFLRVIGNPTSLCQPQTISNTPRFMQHVLTMTESIEPCQHPCLLILPQIFLKAIKGISSLVDAFLGITKGSLIGLTSSRISSSQPAASPISTQPPTSIFTSMLSLTHENRAVMASARPKCNSILHLFGEWLFDAAHIGTEAWIQNCKKQASEASRRPSSMIMDNRKGSLSLSQPSSLNENIEMPPGLTIDKFESGRAEAVGALCRIFCAKKTGEEILPVYLARFYVALQQGLRIPETKECEETLASILYNSSDLFRLDLDGIQVLLPSFIAALELVLPEKELKMKSQTVPRLINILMNALQVETDAQNTHMLLGGLLLSVQDSVTFEETEHTGEMVQMSPPVSDMNLLSSDSAHALFVRATYLVCHRLISSWKTDLNVSLAALELLSGLARMHIKDSDALECKRAVKWICDYICYQCSRPTPSHTKDLHSTIVAAFQCISAWLMQHPYLLQDKDCLTTVLEVVELGISGTKSIGKPGEPPKLKDEKELKPVSMRVRDAAESLMTVILEQVGYFPSECGAQSLSSLLDEETLMKYCNSYPNSGASVGPMSHEAAVQKFRYFVTENSTILALLEEPLGNDQDPQPTITLIIRGPFGRHTWTMQLRHLPRSKSGTKYHHAPNPGRPVPMNDTPMRQEVEQKYFPDGVDKIPPCVADYSIPTLEEIVQKIGNESTKCLFQLLENQTVYEKFAWAETDNSVDSLGHAQEAVPPAVCHEFQAARLFLSHFGFLSLGENAKKESGSPLLMVLDAKKSGFASEIQSLDRVSPRTYDTVYVFYVKAGQTTPIEIVDNMSGENVNGLDPHFWSMLLSLGWRVNVDEHAGWTGFTSSSWHINQCQGSEAEFAPLTSGSEEMNFNGSKRVLYWADVNGEIAFVVPNHSNRFDMEATDGGCQSMPTSSGIDGGKFMYERSVSECPPLEAIPNITKPMPLGQKPRTLSLDIDRSQQRVEPIAPTRRRAGTSKASSAGQASSKIFLVWLESFEDHLTFPMEDLLAYCRTGEENLQQTATKASDCHIIYLQALSSGLLRVKLQGPAGRMNFATPLVDGMVVSRRVVGNLVRQTAHNMARRRRLDNDGYQPPHVRRRLKVQEIVQKYKVDLSEPELLAHLFKF
uniref:Uncharacterized protein n=1 Tax=Phlebotomus papatasi TaxID=29031 RepID=A0A1B0D4J4_PHLPP